MIATDTVEVVLDVVVSSHTKPLTDTSTLSFTLSSASSTPVRVMVPAVEPAATRMVVELAVYWLPAAEPPMPNVTVTSCPLAVESAAVMVATPPASAKVKGSDDRDTVGSGVHPRRAQRRQGVGK